MRSEQEAARAVEQYSDTVRRLCMVHLKNHADTEDIFQTVFLKYVLSSVAFESREHEKAWFIRVTINACRDLLKGFFRSRTVSLDEIAERPAEITPEHREVLEAVLSLPRKYREVVYLHYYEDYTCLLYTSPVLLTAQHGKEHRQQRNRLPLSYKIVVLWRERPGVVRRLTQCENFKLLQGWFHHTMISAERKPEKPRPRADGPDA